MIPVTVTMRSREANVPPIDVPGYALSAESPLVVTRWMVFDKVTREWWWDEKNGYCITHRPTGFHLGHAADGNGSRGESTWCALGDAWAVLLRCDPSMPMWMIAGVSEQAREACRAKFEGARRT